MQMKKKILLTIGIVCLVLVMVFGIWRYITVQNRRNDPHWQIVEQIYKIENALTEVDVVYERDSITKITPFSYTDSEGNIITYFCCQTTYISNESRKHTGLNNNVIGMVIDLTQIKNRRECKVNEYDAFLCEMGDHTYLCWTLSPEISCVISYCADAVVETDILRMAESVLIPED